MKNLLLGLILLNVSTSTFASHCEAYFEGRASEQAIENFMEKKLNISSEEITNFKMLESKSFVSRKQSAALLLLSPVIVIGITIDKHSTFKELVNDLRYCGDNLKMKYLIEFSKDNQLCTVNLKVKLKTDLASLNGYTSVVKQKYKPVCR